MELEIEKWHGCRNDFVVVWIEEIHRDLIVPSLKRAANSICARDGSGVGADGILVIAPKDRHQVTPCELTIINSDGSIAKNCGNGLRCAAASARRKAEEFSKEPPEAIEFSITSAGDVACFFMVSGSQKEPLVAVEMGIPLVGKAPWCEAFTGVLRENPPSFRAKVERYGLCDLGNPHLMIWLNDAVSKVEQEDYARELQGLGELGGINVHYAETGLVSDVDQRLAGQEIGGTIGEAFKADPFERGVGWTQACGSGACAVVADACEEGLTAWGPWHRVAMPGGHLYVRWDDEESPIVLAGPATLVFRGKLPL